MFSWKLLATTQHCVSVARVCPIIALCPAWLCIISVCGCGCLNVFLAKQRSHRCQRMNGKRALLFSNKLLFQVFEQLVALWHLRALHPKMHNCCKIIWNLMIFQWQRVIQSRAQCFSAICCKLGFARMQISMYISPTPTTTANIH